MIRLQIAFVGVFGLLAVNALLLEPPATPTPQQTALDRRVEQRTAFVERLDIWERELASGSRSLREVTRSVGDYCRVFYPYYLADVEASEEGETLERKIGANLLLIFTMRLKELTCPPETKGIIARLERELAAW